MRSHSVAVLGCLAALAVGGCRTNPAITALENENTQLENVIYQQRDIIEDYRRQLEACRMQGGTGSAQPSMTDGPSLSMPQPRLAPFKDRPKTSKLDVPDEVPEPVVEMPSKAAPGVPEMFRAPAEKKKPANKSSLPPPPSSKDDAFKIPAHEASSSNGGQSVARLEISKILAWDNDSRSAAGDQGLSVVVEPCDAAGRLIRQPAAISIVVLDPAESGQAARVARWDFSADEVARLIGNVAQPEGIRLEMIWPEAPPVNNQLHLFVRYWTPDGRKVEADQAFDVDTPAIRGPNWEPAGPELPLPEEDQTAAQSPKTDLGNSTSSADSPKPSARVATVPSRTPTPAPPRPEWSPNRP